MLKIWLCLMMVCAAAPVWALNESYADRQTPFNTVTDFIATIGKSGKAKSRIIQARRAERRKIRLEEMENKKRAEINKRMKRQERIIMQKINAPYKK